MRTSIHPLITGLALGLLTLVWASCSPAAKQARHLADADRYYNAGDYDKAEIEYLNVVQIEPLNPRAIGRLGLIYSEQGRTDRSIVFIRKGHELQPEDLDLRLKLGQIDLAFGNIKEARVQAGYVLLHRPQDPEAPQLLATAIAQPGELEETKTRLLALPAPAPASAPVLVALGLIELREGHLKEAEATLKQAQSVDPKFPATYSILGTLQVMQKDLAAAERSFKQAAEASPARSPRRLQYAQFKLRSGDLAAGKQVLEEMTQKAPDFLPAWIARAEIALAEKKFEESTAFVGKVLARDADNLEARLIRGRLHFAKGENDKAVTEFEKLTHTYPKLPGAHFELGRTYAATGEMGKAIASLSQAVNLAPGMGDAVLLLAELNLQKGDYGAVVAALKPRLQQHPEIVQGWLLLAMAYRGQGNVDDALAIYSQLETQQPRNAQPAFLRGQVLLQQKKTAEARKAFERTLELSPESPMALEQLVDLDLMEKKYQAAGERVKAQVAGHPALAGYGQLLLAKNFLAQNDMLQAETALKKAIELMPDSQTAYFLLGRLYASTNQQPKALASLAQAVTRNPKDVRSFLLMGVINDQLKNYPAARDAYEKVLALDPRQIGVLNNLAYLYAEQFGQTEKALELAQKARDLLPNDPTIGDTLGWVLYKQGKYPRALSLLAESAGKLPDSAEILFHLGMTRYMLGQEESARKALQRAVELNKNLPGNDEAQSRLAILATEAGSAEAKPALENALAKHPGDPVALTRLASVYERAGDPALAIKTYLAAMQASPTNVKPMLGLVQVYLAQKDTPKALDLAKTAHKLAPDDPDVTRILGRLAYTGGEYQWAASLLQEAIQKSDSPELYYDLAQALYSVGRTPDAEAALRHALGQSKASQPDSLSATPREQFLRTDEARRFLEMIGLAADPAEAVKQSAQVELLLKSEPAHVPALMAYGAIKEQQFDPAAAGQVYEKVLAIFPDFAPAKLHLAILGAAARVEFDQKTFDRALQARSIYPSDPQLAKALGILTYRKGEYAHAVELLKESAKTRDTDAELWHYLGMAQCKGKDLPNGRQSLQKSLDLGLPSDLAAKTRQTLESNK